MIFITGDTHAEFERRFKTENFPEQKEMTKDDYVIICGDFGGIFDAEGENDLGGNTYGRIKVSALRTGFYG